MNEQLVSERRFGSLNVGLVGRKLVVRNAPSFTHRRPSADNLKAASGAGCARRERKVLHPRSTSRRSLESGVGPECWYSAEFGRSGVVVNKVDDLQKAAPSPADKI